MTLVHRVGLCCALQILFGSKRPARVRGQWRRTHETASLARCACVRVTGASVDTCRRTGALRIDCRHRHRFGGSRRARRHRHDYACGNEPGARDDDQRNRELRVPERRRRHLPGRRHAARLPIVPRPGHRRAAEHRRPRRREAERRRAVRSRCWCRPTPCCCRRRPPQCRRRRRASSWRTCRSTAGASRAR